MATAAVTLHGGRHLAGQVADADDQMHSEWGEVATTVARIAAAKATGGRVVAVGTTATDFESAARDGRLVPFSGDTDLFITPGFQFHAVDLLLTILFAALDLINAGGGVPWPRAHAGSLRSRQGGGLSLLFLWRLLFVDRRGDD